jgi:hypothetical protein
MSRDIQFISVVDDLQVTGQEELEGAVPRTIRVVAQGGGFFSAQRVLINDFAINTFSIASDRVLLVAPGPVFDSTPVEDMKIVVVAGTLTGTREVRLLFGPTRKVREVQGTQKLIQQVVRVLLTNVATNKFATGEGGNIRKLLGESLTADGRSRITAILTQGITSTEALFVSSQALSQNLNDDERLLSLTLNGLVFDEVGLEVRAGIRLVTYTGRNLEIPLIL